MTDWTDEDWTVSYEVRTWTPMNWGSKQIPNEGDLSPARTAVARRPERWSPHTTALTLYLGGGKCFSLDHAFVSGFLEDEKGDIQGWRGACWEGGKRRKNILEYTAYIRKGNWIKLPWTFWSPVYFCSFPLLIPHSPAQSPYVIILCQQSGHMEQYYHPHENF